MSDYGRAVVETTVAAMRSIQGGPQAPVVMLIHGTWGRGSSWTKPGGTLHDSIVADFPQACVKRFEWKGRNRIFDRVIAAEHLAAELWRQDGPVILIAHSHGGNVATMALAMEQQVPDRPERELIAIGTPFLSANQKGPHWRVRSPFLSRRLQVTVMSLISGLYLLSGLLALDLEFTGGSFSDDEIGSRQLSGLSKLLAATTIGIAATTGAAIAVGLFVSLATGLRRTKGRTVASLIAAINLVANSDLNATVHTLRTRGDEAAIAIRVGQTAGSLADKASKPLDRFWAGPDDNGVAQLVLGLLLLSVVPALGMLYQGEGADTHWGRLNEAMALAIMSEVGHVGDEIVALMGSTLVLGALFVAGLLIAIASEYIACGSDGLRLARQVRLSMSRTFPGQDRPIEISLGGHGRPGRLRHSRLMDDTNTVSATTHIVADFVD